MRQGRAGQRKTKSGNRRGAVVAPSPPPPAPNNLHNHPSPLQSTGGSCNNSNNLEDPTAAPTTWKGGPGGPGGDQPPNQQQPFTPGGAGSGFPGGPGGPGGAGPGGPSPFSGGPPVGAGSPGGPYGGGPGGGPPPGSTTPGYTASPAPSGSSTPGPIGVGPGGQSGQFPPPNQQPTPYNNGPPNGPPHQQQFGSPGPPNFGRPGSSGPPGPPFGPPQQQYHRQQQQQQQFVGDPSVGFGMAPGSPFGPGPGGHPGMVGPGVPMGPHPGMVGPGSGMVGPGGPMVGPGPGGPPPGMDRMDPGSLAVPRRHTPYFGQPDYRIYELNKRLQQRTEQPLQESDNLWWDAFATEFFEDDASLTLAFCLEDGPKRYTIGRTLIPRYFRSIFEGGVTELYYNLKHPKESFHNTSITLDCDQCTMITHHGKPLFTKVCTDGRLILEFTFDDLMRIKSWHFAVRAHRELIPRSVVSIHANPDPGMLDQLSKNITRQGITNSTLNYLRLCVILEPMQELMSRHKAYALSPRDCLKTTLFQKWQRMVAPPESQRPASKRRKRKGSNSGGAANNTPPVASKKRSPGPNFSLASQDVMVVGEPSLMGGEFGDEDERLITRLENTQYDAANSLDQHHHPGHLGVGGGVGPPPPHMQHDGFGGPHGGPGGGGGGADSPMGGGPGWGSAAAAAAAMAAAAAAAAVGPGGPGGGPGSMAPNGNNNGNGAHLRDTSSGKKSPAVSQ